MQMCERERERERDREGVWLIRCIRRIISYLLMYYQHLKSRICRDVNLIPSRKWFS